MTRRANCTCLPGLRGRGLHGALGSVPPAVRGSAASRAPGQAQGRGSCCWGSGAACRGAPGGGPRTPRCAATVTVTPAEPLAPPPRSGAALTPHHVLPTHSGWPRAQRPGTRGRGARPRRQIPGLTALPQEPNHPTNEQPEDRCVKVRLRRPGANYNSREPLRCEDGRLYFPEGIGVPEMLRSPDPDELVAQPSGKCSSGVTLDRRLYI